MALINCPRCGGNISERAQQCPHCGCTKQEMELIAEEQRLQAEREAEEARIQAKKEAEELAAQRREWWENNKKKVYVVLAIIIGLVAGVKILKAIVKYKSITLAKQYIVLGDSCVNIYRFDEAQEFYQKAKECTQDPDIQRTVDNQKRAYIYNARNKADIEYNKSLGQLKILLEADSNQFCDLSSSFLDKMIEIYPNKEETKYYQGIRTFPLSSTTQNYEQRGDSLLMLAEYEKALVQYNAFIVLKGMSDSINQKKLICIHCKELLSKAQNAEQEALQDGYGISEYNEVARLYEELYETHPLQNYLSKANTLRQEAEKVTHLYIVDLGLSVKWATCNVGASKPEEYGDYFAWGETVPKSIYNWSTYKYCNGSSSTLTKYNTDNSRGTVDNKTTLELSDDAARANRGSSWRMPTGAELTELREQCTWIWTTQNGVNGYKVTSKSNGKSIFLPAAGYRNDSSLYRAGSYGYYWSSSLSTFYPNHAYSLLFYSDYVDWDSYYYLYIGFTVRPVCQ